MITLRLVRGAAPLLTAAFALLRSQSPPRS